LHLDTYSKVWIGVAALLCTIVAVASATLHAGLPVAAISDVAGALLMLSTLLTFAHNSWASHGRVRLFWFLFAIGWAMWFSDQLVWLCFDVVLLRKVPAMYPADALLFLAGAPMVAGLLLRPHLEPSERNSRLGILDFLLLLLWWLYLYTSFVVCWQYVSPNEALYNRNFDILAGAEAVVLTAVTFAFWRRSTGCWKTFYGWLCAAVAFNGAIFYILNRAIERNVYYTGSWYDLPYWMSFAFFTATALIGRGLTASAETRADEAYGSWMANLGLVAVLSLPVIAFTALLDRQIPPAAARFRVLVTLATMFLMAFLIFVKHHRMNLALKRSNTVLEEASLTDPLTGLRNRRHFSATIEADVSHALRAYADDHDPRTRDLVFYLIDADDFKEINDRYGHEAGDRVLVEMAGRLSSSIRHSDVLVRWGGEEFLIVSRYTDRRDAELLASRVLGAIADAPFAISPTIKLARTCSLGWAAFPWFTADPKAVEYNQVLSLADRALNQAKNSGKNRAIGMLPASAASPSLSVEGAQSNCLPVDVLATAGPITG
jgi:diguanylate cyclase (GGDEF)-like protein